MRYVGMFPMTFDPDMHYKDQGLPQNCAFDLNNKIGGMQEQRIKSSE